MISWGEFSTGDKTTCSTKLVRIQRFLYMVVTDDDACVQILGREYKVSGSCLLGYLPCNRGILT